MSCLESCTTKDVPTRQSPLYRVHVTTLFGLIPLILFLSYPRSSLSTQIGGAMLAFQLAFMWIFRGCIQMHFYAIRGAELVFLGMQLLVLGLVVSSSDTQVQDVVAPGIYSGFTVFIYYLSLWPFLRQKEGLPLSGFLVKLFRYVMYEHSLGSLAQIVGLLATSRAWSSNRDSTHVAIRGLLVAQLGLGLAWWLLGYSSAFAKDLRNAVDDTLYERLATSSRRYGWIMLVFLTVELVFQIYVITFCLTTWPQGTRTTVGWWCLFASAVTFITTLAGLLLSTTTNRIWLDDIQQFMQDLQVRSSAAIDFGFRGVVEAHPGSVILTPAVAFAVFFTLPFFILLGLLRNNSLATESCDPLARFLFTGLALGFLAIVLSALTLVAEMAFKKYASFMFNLDLAYLAATTWLAIFTVIFSGSLPACAEGTLEREGVRTVIAWSAMAYFAMVLATMGWGLHFAGSIELEGDLWALWGFNAGYYESHRASLAGRRCFTALKVWMIVMVPTLVVELALVTISGVGRVRPDQDSPIQDVVPQLDGRSNAASGINAIRAFLALSFFLLVATMGGLLLLTAITRLRGPPRRARSTRLTTQRTSVGEAQGEPEAKADAEEGGATPSGPAPPSGPLPREDDTSPAAESPERGSEGDEDDAEHQIGDEASAEAPEGAQSIDESGVVGGTAGNSPASFSATAPAPAIAHPPQAPRRVATESLRASSLWVFEDARVAAAAVTFLSVVVHFAIAVALFADGEASHQAASVLMLLTALARAAAGAVLIGEARNAMERKVTFDDALQAAISAHLTARRTQSQAAPEPQASAEDDWGIADVGEEIERERQLSADARKKLWEQRAAHPEARNRLWVRRLDQKGAVVWVEVGDGKAAPTELETPRPDITKKMEEARTFRDVETAELEPRGSLTAPSTPMLSRAASDGAPGLDIEAPPLRRRSTESNLLESPSSSTFSNSFRSFRGGLVTAGRHGMHGLMHGFGDVFMEEDSDGERGTSAPSEDVSSDDEAPPPHPSGLEGQWLRQLNADGSVTWVDGAAFASDDRDLSTFTSDISSYDLAAAAVLPLPAKLDFFRDNIAKLRIPNEENNAIALTLRREALLETAREAFLGVDAKDFRKVFRITMAGEEGVDVGGVLRDFFASCTTELVDKSQVFTFAATDNITYQFNRFAALVDRPDARVVSPGSEETAAAPATLDDYRFLGRFLGKAMMDEVNVDLHFIRPLYKHMLGLPLRFSDLEFCDRGSFESLRWVLDNDGVEYLSLDFTVTETNGATGAILELELGEEGRSRDVNDENKREYVKRMFEHKMLHAISGQLNAFLRGLYEVIPMGLLSIFDFQELELAIAGLKEIDVSDWRAHTIYEGELRPGHPVSRWFFEILQHFDTEQRARLLQFVTGTSRVPVGGFRNLQGDRGLKKAFELRGIAGGDAAWPRSHTCFNRLDLPIYTTRRKLREVLTRIILLEASDAFTIS